MKIKVTNGPNWKSWRPISRISGFSLVNDCASALKIQLETTSVVYLAQISRASKGFFVSFFNSSLTYLVNRLRTSSTSGNKALICEHVKQLPTSVKLSLNVTYSVWGKRRRYLCPLFLPFFASQHKWISAKDWIFIFVCLKTFTVVDKIRIDLDVAHHSAEFIVVKVFEVLH